MAGTVLIALSTFAGISFDQDHLSLHPCLPDGWESLSFGITFKGIRFQLKITKTQLVIIADKDALILLNGRMLNISKAHDKIFTF